MVNMNQYENQLYQILRLDSELNKIKDEDILLERILTEARKVVNADAGSIYVSQGDELSIRYSQNETLQSKLPPGEKLIYKFFTVPINRNSISGYVADTGEILNIPDAYKISRKASYSYNTKYDELSGYKTCSMLTIPLSKASGELLGVIQFINKRGATKEEIIPFDAEDEVLLAHFATNATVALERAQMTRAILLRMIKMAELRDPKETGPHVNRVAGYAVEIYEQWAKKRGIDTATIQKNRDNLRMAAMLHDVGKVAISDTILKKPARFTEAEYEIMKQHTVFGADLFQDNQSELDFMARDIALTHHENWDGTGYPGRQQGASTIPLKGEEIPLWGRIVAIADVYDALVSSRVYKEAWTEEQVLEEMKKMDGTKFDPELLDRFFEVLPMIKTISDTYSG